MSRYDEGEVQDPGAYLSGVETGLAHALEVVEAYLRGASRRLLQVEDGIVAPDQKGDEYGTQRYFEGKVDALLDVVGSLKLEQGLKGT